MADELVLVTGGTGFIAQHCVLALLGAGYRVRTTLRSPGREAEVRQYLTVGGAELVRRRRSRRGSRLGGSGARLCLCLSRCVADAVTGLMEGEPGCPKINSGFVDVRDVADLHVRAMTNGLLRVGA